MRIIGYTYLADVHCPDCTKKATQRSSTYGGLKLNHMHPHAVDQAYLPENGRDEHGLCYNLQDREGNLVHPVFDTDEQFGTTLCGGCGAVISQGPIAAVQYRVRRVQTYIVAVPVGVQYKNVAEYISTELDGCALLDPIDEQIEIEAV